MNKKEFIEAAEEGFVLLNKNTGSAVRKDTTGRIIVSGVGFVFSGESLKDTHPDEDAGAALSVVEKLEIGGTVLNYTVGVISTKDFEIMMPTKEATE